MSNNNNDGYLSAGPSGVWSGTLDYDNSDIPIRTHTSIQGRAIEYYNPPISDIPIKSGARYIRIPMDDSLKMRDIIQNEIPPIYCYEFELLCWPYEVDENSGDRVLINNLWTNPENSGSAGLEGYYRILLTDENEIAFEYIKGGQQNPIIHRFTSIQKVTDNSWNRINIRFLYHCIHWESTKIIFGINGEIDPSDRQSGDITTTPTFYCVTSDRQLTIGADPYSRKYVAPDYVNDPKQFAGILDEIRIQTRKTYDQWGDNGLTIGKQIYFIDFDEMAGDKSLDQTRYSNDADIFTESSIWGSDGIYGGYIKCLGNGDPSNYATIDDIPQDDTDNPKHELTLEAWIYPEGIPFGDHINIVSKAYYSNQQPYYSYYLKIHNGLKVEFGVGTSGQENSVKSNSYVQVGEWTHIAGSIKNGVAKIYINGELDNTVTHSWTGKSILYDEQKPVYIGRYQHNCFQPPETYTFLPFDGWIDQVGLCDYEKKFAPEIVRLNFEDGSSSPTAFDWTPYINNGLLVNGATMGVSGKYSECVDLPSTATNPHVKIDLSVDTPVNGEFTVDLWVKPESDLEGPSIIASQYDTWELGMTADKYPFFKVKTSSGSWITATHTLPIIDDYNDLSWDVSDRNSWHHVMGVFKSNQVLIFLDGKSGYGDGSSNDATQSFASYTRVLSTEPIYLGVKSADGTSFSNQYNGLIDSFRLRKDAYDLTDDIDGDGMSDKYEIIRSLHSDQFDPFVHNTRFAVLLSAVTHAEWNQTTLLRENTDPFKERHFKIESYNMRDILMKQGYDDDDIIYLDLNGIFEIEHDDLPASDWGLPSFPENGAWIDGVPSTNNFLNTLDQLKDGGQYDLDLATSTGGVPDVWNTQEITVPKIDDDDCLYIEINGHGCSGGEENDAFQLKICQQAQVPYYIEQYINASYIKPKLDGITCKYSSVVVSACHSGNLITSTIANCKWTKNNRVLVTSSSPDEGSWISALFMSSRLGGYSYSSRELDVGYIDPNTYTSGGCILLQNISWGFNADDIELVVDWVLQNPRGTPYMTPKNREDNSRNIVVSVQEALRYAQMWVTFRTYMGATPFHNPPQIDEGSGVPGHVVV